MKKKITRYIEIVLILSVLAMGMYLKDDSVMGLDLAILMTFAFILVIVIGFYVLNIFQNLKENEYQLTMKTFWLPWLYLFIFIFVLSILIMIFLYEYLINNRYFT
ncbi:hypothetical protein [Lactobacillus terrae]|uniref:hypothetical protein n=1 Tax=Lactobacillus terrae TaxID=2269374 RepID=UPI000C1B6523|nr:hypothetical protein [Lactobacillus terrae]